ncbi:MAG: SipW-dependent-type signal peptide-containing protein [Micrococcales bacterium]|nr:SipW-dependent-type signal peptide-containing protein [Micrococcales bacterium]MCL2667194.1 SipW-dependent-type signal peptide-containing protein [Micrococcales bacterium]
MSTPETTGVVGQERRRRSPLPFLLTAVVTAALLAGGTFAVWSASADLDDGTITAGDLNLTLTGGPTYYDVSADRSDAKPIEITGGLTLEGHEVGEGWLMVPGDTVAVVYQVEVTLVGGNMIGALSLDIDDDEPVVDIDYTFEAYWVYGDKPLKADEDTGLMYLTPGGSLHFDDAKALRMASTKETFVVVIYATFDPETKDRNGATKEEVLADVSITLTHVRTPGLGKFGTPTPGPSPEG